MKPPMLSSGHHLQLPAHAKIKTLPVSVKPPVIQDKILATAAASNTSGTGENISAPSFVSPVNTMKMSASESLETKSVGEVSSSLIGATSQEFINNSAKVSTSSIMENKKIPIKWVVYENPESSTLYIVPVKSSKEVASKLLKTLANMKNTKNNSTSILPVCSSSNNAKMPSALSHDNPQISSITQHETVSSGSSSSIGINVAHKYVAKGSTYDSSGKDLSSKTATDPTSPPVVHHAAKEEEQQAKITSGMPIGMKHIQEQQKKHYLQLRKKIGLSKEERVYLRRVPSKNSEASVFSNSVQMNDIDDLMSTPMKCESEKEGMIIGGQEEKMNIKRKTNATPILENPKRKNVTTMQNSECNSSYSEMENLNNSCTQNLPEQEVSTSFLQGRHNVSNPWVSNSSEENRVLNSTSNCHENETALSESSFKKDIFPFSPPDLDETIKEEKIIKLKRLLRERDAALEATREKMHQC